MQMYQFFLEVQLQALNYVHAGDGHTHMDPFIEIWDRNRSETDIDGQEEPEHGLWQK